MSIKKIVVLGGTGMLGSMVVKYLTSSLYKYDINWSTREKSFSDTVVKSYGFYFDPLMQSSWRNIPNDADLYINAIGTINVHMRDINKDAIYLNAYYPHLLAEKFNNVLHITTDCVFSGKDEDGQYNENSLHDTTDSYGKSKSLGEPIDKCMVIRTSIIGPELHNFTSLISWVLQQNGKTIPGYTNHVWNGVTTLQYAKICEQIIDKNLYQKGLFHVHSPSIVSKYELVSEINNHYKVGAKVIPTQADIAVNRSLGSIKPLCRELRIPEIFEQISEL